MKKIRVAINGFGRIGRLVFRSLVEDDRVELVAINDLSENKMLAHLLKYDSVHGTFNRKVIVNHDHLQIDSISIKTFKERDPENLPWGELNIDIIIESTGIFTSYDGAYKHILAGAKRVLISAPGKGDKVKTVVIGVNEDTLTGEELIISNASCTTNCLAPMIKVLNREFGLERGFITTVHAYTSDQQIQDAPHRDFRRARAAALSIIPTSTGAANAVGIVIPEIKGKLDGIALRVPIPTGSITDLTVQLSRDCTLEEINQAFKSASQNELKGILAYLEDEIVSADIVGSKYSSLFDPFLTKVNKNLVKINAWYDNEAGYAHRIADLTILVGEKMK